jgi:hypothetical protein
MGLNHLVCSNIDILLEINIRLQTKLLTLFTYKISLNGLYEHDLHYCCFYKVF